MEDAPAQLAGDPNATRRVTRPLYYPCMTALTAKHRASIVVAVAAAATLLNTSPSNQPVAQPAATAFIGVNVLPMDKEGLLADQTVVVTDGKIASIAPAGKAQVPAGAVKVEGKG